MVRAARAPRQRAARAPDGEQSYLRQGRPRSSRAAAIPLLVDTSWGLGRTDHRLEGDWKRPTGWGRRNRRRIRLEEKEMTGWPVCQLVVGGFGKRKIANMLD
jgi:hypothetical protein